MQRNQESGVGFTVALGALQAFSLVITEKDERLYGMHRLVQLSVQAWLDHEGTLAQYQAEALNVLIQEFPQQAIYDHWSKCQVLIAHVLAALRYTFRTDEARLK